MLPELSRTTYVAAAVALIAVGGLGFILTNGQDTGGEELDTLRIGHVPTPGTSPHYTAIEEGFYEAEGFDAEMVQLPGPEIGKALLNGELEIGSSATTPANYQINAELPVRLVAARGFDFSGQQGASLVMRKGLNVTDLPEDIRGTTLCASTAGGMGELWIQVWADQVGLEHGEDYDFTYLGDETSFSSAFASGSVDGCFTDAATQGDVLVIRGLGRRVANFSRADIISAFVVVREEWATQEQDKLRRFLRAYARAAEYAREHPQERLENVAKYSPWTVEELEQFTIPRIPEDLRVNTTKIEIGRDLMYEYGQIDQKNPVDPYVNNTFIAQVQRELGQLS